MRADRALPAYLTESAASGYAPATVRSWGRTLGAVERWHGRPLVLVTGEQWVAWRQGLVGRLSHSSAGVQVRAVRAFLRWAAARSLVEVDLARCLGVDDRLRPGVPLAWSAAVDQWSRFSRAEGHTTATIRTRVDDLRALAVDVRGDPYALTRDDLVDWLAGRAWAVETRRRVFFSVRSFYRWAVETGRCVQDPTARLRAPRQVRVSPRPVPAAAFRAARAVAGEREQLMLLLAGVCGLRRAEVARVHARDIVGDADAPTLVVHGKGGHERTVPLPATLAERMLRAVTVNRDGHPHPDGPGYVFPGRDGGHLTDGHVGKVVSRLLPAGWAMHTLRHRAATRLYAVDRDLLTVQQLLGHASPATTQRYVQVPDYAARRLVEIVADEVEADV